MTSLLVLAAFSLGTQQGGIAVIQLENTSAKEVNFQLSDKQYEIKSKEIRKFFVVPGTYKCSWNGVHRSLSLDNGDILILTPEGFDGLPKQPANVPTAKQIPDRKPAEPKEPVPIKEPKSINKPAVGDTPKAIAKAAPAFNPLRQARIKLTVPKDCPRFWVDHHVRVCDKDVTEYTFITPNLDRPEMIWYYIITIERKTAGGTTYHEARKIIFRQGDTVNVDFK